jgi:hypothetical protein
LASYRSNSPEPSDGDSSTSSTSSRRRAPTNQKKAESRKRQRVKKTPEQRAAGFETLRKAGEATKARKEKRRAERAVRRARQRAKKQDPAVFVLNPAVLHHNPLDIPVQRLQDDASSTLNHASTAYTGVRLNYSAEPKPNSTEAPVVKGKIWTKEELVYDWGFEYMEWDGLYVPCESLLLPAHFSSRSTQLILDKHDRIVVTCVGRPPLKKDETDPWMDEVCTPAFEEMLSAAECLGKCKEHGRGDFATLACGISFGGGQQVCLSFHVLVHC